MKIPKRVFIPSKLIKAVDKDLYYESFTVILYKNAHGIYHIKETT